MKPPKDFRALPWQKAELHKLSGAATQATTISKLGWTACGGDSRFLYVRFFRREFWSWDRNAGLNLQQRTYGRRVRYCSLYTDKDFSFSTWIFSCVRETWPGGVILYCTGVGGSFNSLHFEAHELRTAACQDVCVMTRTGCDWSLGAMTDCSASSFVPRQRFRSGHPTWRLVLAGATSSRRKSIFSQTST